LIYRCAAETNVNQCSCTTAIEILIHQQVLQQPTRRWRHLLQHVPWDSIFLDCSTKACVGCWAEPWNIHDNYTSLTQCRAHMQKAILLRELSNMLYLKEHSMCY